MNIIIPMAGAGRRFAEKGYRASKPAVLTTDRRSGRDFPMAVCAAMDLPGVRAGGGNLIFIDRRFHKTDGTEEAVRKHYPDAAFITADKLTEGQACTCLLAKDVIDNEEPLLIAGCDNGMEMDQEKFEKMTSDCEVLVFTYRHDQAVAADPDAYGWMLAEEETGKITGVSVKKAVSDTPMEDHAVTSAFWFRHGSSFVRAAEKMIEENDRVNNEFYVDQAVRHCLALGMDARVFEIDRYIGWGTPKDYEQYQAVIRYWREFTDSRGFLPGKLTV